MFLVVEEQDSTRSLTFTITIYFKAYGRSCMFSYTQFQVKWTFSTQIFSSELNEIIPELITRIVGNNPWNIR